MHVLLQAQIKKENVSITSLSMLYLSDSFQTGMGRGPINRSIDEGLAVRASSQKMLIVLSYCNLLQPVYYFESKPVCLDALSAYHTLVASVHTGNSEFIVLVLPYILT